MHARLESAVDRSIDAIDASASAQVHWQPIPSVWTPVVAELKEANALVSQVVTADHTARMEAGHSHAAYTRDLMGIEQIMVIHQVANSASVLASIWAYEDEEAGTPAVCTQRIAIGEFLERGSRTLDLGHPSTSAAAGVTNESASRVTNEDSASHRAGSACKGLVLDERRDPS